MELNLNQPRLSDALHEIRTFLSQFEETGVQLEGQAVRTLRGHLDDFKKLARQLENEVSRRRWNELPDDSGKFAQQQIMNAICSPGSNVHLFPVIPRPFHDGQRRGPGGAA